MTVLIKSLFLAIKIFFNSSNTVSGFSVILLLSDNLVCIFSNLMMNKFYSTELSYYRNSPSPIPRLAAVEIDGKALKATMNFAYEGRKSLCFRSTVLMRKI
jgi:hypothetical protein